MEDSRTKRKSKNSKDPGEKELIRIRLLLRSRSHELIIAKFWFPGCGSGRYLSCIQNVFFLILDFPNRHVNWLPKFQRSKYILLTWSPPSKDPSVSAILTSPLKVSADGLKTKTPELKQSGQPMSGVADNSLRSNSSSILLTTRVSASMKTHLVYWMGRLEMKVDMSGNGRCPLNGIRKS